MTTRSFGKRITIPASSAPAQIMSLQAHAAVAEPALDEFGQPIHSAKTLGERDLIDAMPLLTFGIIIFLMLIFGMERYFSFDIDREGEVSVGSLVALGASSWDRIIGHGEIWRLFLAPLLHGSNSHFVGNAIALFFVGIRLEPMIGRNWLAFIFFASAIGGEIGSLSGNPADVPGVGASGAISGLIGALFIQSFHSSVPREERWPMLRTSLVFGVPALLPLFFAKSGNTDYFAHAGGALAGAAIAWAIAEWEEMRSQAARALAASLGYVAIAGLSCGFIALGYPAYARQAALQIPSALKPEDMKVDAKLAVLLTSRYPSDPFSHIYKAVYLASNPSLPGAEQELRQALDLAPPGIFGKHARITAQFVLAVVLAERKQMREAISLAGEFCDGKYGRQMRNELSKLKLCLPPKR